MWATSSIRRRRAGSGCDPDVPDEVASCAPRASNCRRLMGWMRATGGAPGGTEVGNKRGSDIDEHRPGEGEGVDRGEGGRSREKGTGPAVWRGRSVADQAARTR